MEKILVSPDSKFDPIRKLWYKLIWLDDKNATLLMTIWGKTVSDCNELTEGVMEKMSK